MKLQHGLIDLALNNVNLEQPYGFRCWSCNGNGWIHARDEDRIWCKFFCRACMGTGREAIPFEEVT